jgi:hypothetical protein
MQPILIPLSLAQVTSRLGNRLPLQIVSSRLSCTSQVSTAGTVPARDNFVKSKRRTIFTSTPAKRNRKKCPYCQHSTQSTTQQGSLGRIDSRTERTNSRLLRSSNSAAWEGSQTRSSPRRRTAIRLAAAGGTLGVLLLAFGEDIKHTYSAAARSGRVLTTLAVCINE